MLLLSNIPQIGGLGNRNLPARKYPKRKYVAVLLGVARKLLAMQWLMPTFTTGQRRAKTHHQLLRRPLSA